MPDSGRNHMSAVPVYVSARELADRWRCSRSTVARIAQRQGFARLLVGKGRNGMVRYLRKEVDDFESVQRT